MAQVFTKINTKKVCQRATQSEKIVRYGHFWVLPKLTINNRQALKEKNMAESSEATTTEQATPQELAEVIAEFEQYRERLVNDTMEAGKKAKLTKSAVMAQLEPELNKIDGILTQLRQQQASQ